MYPPADEPTLEQIASRAALIRAEWSDDEHYRRAGQVPPSERNWQPARLRGISEPIALRGGADSLV